MRFEELRRRLRDRRSEYSFRKHLGRLKKEGRLTQIGIAAAAVLVVSGITFGRCQSSNITGPSQQSETAPVLQPSPSLTTTETTSETFRNFAFTGYNPCNGDAVAGTGTRHELVHFTINADGSTKIKKHTNDAWKGKAADDQTKYSASDVHDDMQENSGTTFEHRDINNEHLISEGRSPNWILHLVQKTYIDALDPTKNSVEVKGFAKCPPTSSCSFPDGCPDLQLSLALE